MAIISTDLTKIGFKRETTFGTGISVASGFYLYGRATLEDSRAVIKSDDIGFAGKQTQQVFGVNTVNLTITCDLAFNQCWVALAASLFGTEANAVEVTGGQGDYRHDIDLADNPSFFWTVAWLHEDDRISEVYSFKPASMTMSGSSNDKGTVTFAGPCSRTNETGSAGVANTSAIINALTPRAYQTGVLNGTNSFFRINADGGAGLAVGDNKELLNYSFTLTRPMDSLFPLRAANSIYTVEPQGLGDIEGTLDFQLSSNDEATFDFLAGWRAGTTYKAELFFDGAQIAAGVNRSIRLLMPLLQSNGQRPEGFSPSAKNQRMLGKMMFRTFKRSAAPTGMTGVTDYARLSVIDLLATKWTV